VTDPVPENGSTIVACAPADLCHRQWQFEEAVNRLDNQMKIERVSGVSEETVFAGVAAKVPAGSAASLMCSAALEQFRRQPLAHLQRSRDYYSWQGVASVLLLSAS
jgi:hypothetical protein